MNLFSSPAQLLEIKRILTTYLRLPFSGQTIPGNILEQVIARVRNGRRLGTYDFVDVVADPLHCGWQVKSTKAETPVTWKRAKIPDQNKLISASRSSSKGARELGRAIIDFCNDHIRESLITYELQTIGYARLIVKSSGKVMYFEKTLCTATSPIVFRPDEFEWKWSKQKAVGRKEQLQALHGIHKATKKKWWAWHGLGENQLHFSGEREWWPNESDPHVVVFNLPTEREKIPLDQAIAFLERLELPV
jgi:hypothetical protein